MLVGEDGPGLLPGTLRDNVLFGLPLESAAYRRALDASGILYIYIYILITYIMIYICM